MTRWERFKRWVVRLLVPDWDREVLLSRLSEAHGRLREMYWGEQAKVAATARIARLEESLIEACVLAAERGGVAAKAAGVILEEAGLRDRAVLALEEFSNGSCKTRGYFPCGDPECVFHGENVRPPPTVLVCLCAEPVSKPNPNCPAHGKEGAA